MNIALTANDKKKELMVQFCIAYCGILASHNICATNSTGRLVAEATGLPISLYLPDKSGSQQIRARIAYNEIDLVICFADPESKTYSTDIGEIARLCDQHNIPFATNVASAEVLIRALKEGYLDWRDIVNPKR